VHIIMPNPAKPTGFESKRIKLEDFISGAGGDSVKTYANYAALPVTGVENTIYITLDDYKMFIYDVDDYEPIGGGDETDPVFTQWLSDTPPAYPDDIPSTVGLLDETAHDLLDHTGLPGVSSSSRLESYTTTATATGTTTLTASSTFMQYFTGTLGQIIVMPDVTTLVLGFQFKIINNSTQALTINSSGANLIISLAAGSEITLTCIAITGTGAASWSKLAEAVNIPASEKALSVGTTGVKQDYDIIEQIIVPGTIASAVWTTGQATYTGKQGQWTADANYKYDCIATNTWIRTPINEARYDMWLADINDSSADKTSSDLDTAYPAAIIGQWVAGTVRNIYYKHATNDWIRIPRNITTDNTFIPEKLADQTGIADNATISVKAYYDIISIRAVAETTTAGNISIGSADGLTDIVPVTALPVVIGTGLRLLYVIDPNYPTASNRTLYVNISSAATVKIQIVLQKIYV
jgi:hypothetical protein